MGSKGQGSNTFKHIEFYAWAINKYQEDIFCEKYEERCIPDNLRRSCLSCFKKHKRLK